MQLVAQLSVVFSPVRSWFTDSGLLVILVPDEEGRNSLRNVGNSFHTDMADGPRRLPYVAKTSNLKWKEHLMLSGYLSPRHGAFCCT